MSDQAIVITGKDNIEFARMLALKGALRLETLGMGRRGRSAYSIVKSEYGFRGNKQSVYTQFCEFVESEKGRRA